MLLGFAAIFIVFFGSHFPIYQLLACCMAYMLHPIDEYIAILLKATPLDLLYKNHLQLKG